VIKPYARKASVLWVGTRGRGKGAISTPSAALGMALYASDGSTKRRGTNPTELIAAAHAGSFSLTLADELEGAGYSPRQIDTTATVTMENLTAGWRMTQVHLDVVARVPNLAQCDFVDAALRAKANCPVSRALTANISMRAELTCQEVDGQAKPRPGQASLGHGPRPKNQARRTGTNTEGQVSHSRTSSPTKFKKNI
jgi:osmotically inducible protein OsmC